MGPIVLNLVAVVLVVLSGVLLSYDHITAFGLDLGIPQGLSLGMVGLTALLAAADAVVQGLGQNYQSDQAAEERERTARRARLQNRLTVLQVRHQLDPGDATRAALRDFLALLEEYGD